MRAGRGGGTKERLPANPTILQNASPRVHASAHICRVLVTEMTNEKKEHVNGSNALLITRA